MNNDSNFVLQDALWYGDNGFFCQALLIRLHSCLVNFVLFSSTLFVGCGKQAISKSAEHVLTKEHTGMSKVDTVGELGNNLMSIYEDRKGTFWFGSWEDGLYAYDGQITRHFTTLSGLPHPRVEDVQEDSSGRLFINTIAGVWRYDGNHFTAVNANESEVWNLQNGDLWFKSLNFDGSVYRYDGSVLTRLHLPKCPLDDKWNLRKRGHPSPYGIYTIYRDQKGNIWFGTAAFGVCRYNGITFDWITEEDVTELHQGPANGVRSIIEDKDGYFWFNSAYRYKVYNHNAGENNRFYLREKSIGNLDGNPDSDFWEYMSVAKDHQNALWMVTYGNGVWKFDGKETKEFPIMVDGKNITLFSIYQDRRGELWLGTHENGVYKFNGKTFERFMP